MLLTFARNGVHSTGAQHWAVTEACAEVLVQLCARGAMRNSTTTLASAVVLYLGKWAAVWAFTGTRVLIELLGCYAVCICSPRATTIT